MKRKLSWLSYGYGWVLRLYPSSHRDRFTEEMQAVFAQALDDATGHGWAAVMRLCCREIRDLPAALLTEYWRLFQQWCTIHLLTSEPLHSDLPGVVPVGDGSIPHLLFVVTSRNPRLRRLFDVIVALCGLVLTAPLFLLLPILIKLDSPGPILYCAPRIGKNGQPYMLYKFRSMYTSNRSPTQSSAAIPTPLRQTRVGRLTRRYCLDELPQLVNVLKGEMSILGPRPGTPMQ